MDNNQRLSVYAKQRSLGKKSVSVLPDYPESLTVAELRQVGDRCGLSFPSKARKAEIIERIQNYEASALPTDGLTPKQRKRLRKKENRAA